MSGQIRLKTQNSEMVKQIGLTLYARSFHAPRIRIMESTMVLLAVSFIRFSGSTKFDRCLKWSLSTGNENDNRIRRMSHIIQAGILRCALYVLHTCYYSQWQHQANIYNLKSQTGQGNQQSKRKQTYLLFLSLWLLHGMASCTNLQGHVHCSNVDCQRRPFKKIYKVGPASTYIKWYHMYLILILYIFFPGCEFVCCKQDETWHLEIMTGDSKSVQPHLTVHFIPTTSEMLGKLRLCKAIWMCKRVAPSSAIFCRARYCGNERLCRSSSYPIHLSLHSGLNVYMSWASDRTLGISWAWKMDFTQKGYRLMLTKQHEYTEQDSWMNARKP